MKERHVKQGTSYLISLDYSPTPLDADTTVVDVLRQMLMSGVPEQGGFGVEELRWRIGILQAIDRALDTESHTVRLSPDGWRFLHRLVTGCSFSEARPVFLAAVDAVLDATSLDTEVPKIDVVGGGAT